MKQKRFWTIKCFCILLGSLLFAACGSTSTQESAVQEQVTDEAVVQGATEEAVGEQTANSQVATADEMAAPVDILDEDMVPVTAEELKSGVYSINVDSSSTMFKITACELTVENGQMTAQMTMGGTGYRYLYMGTGEEAVEASKEDYIPYVENASGEHTFTVPVESLDAAVDCAAFSNSKEKWYDRILVFRADSLPLDAFTGGRITTVEELSLEDGVYTVAVMLEGGSGKSSVESPAKLKVENGKAYATIIWSSKNYDYMLVDGARFENENPEGNSTFTIPVAGFDGKVPVVGDTTAMSTPYEIDYTLYFASDSIQKVE
ncbi:MAG: hypothetical protein IJ833_09790 [Lachnospiraceae bacterium]|nr:hypothetical protein [Lachnospiraceae bacterium]